MMIAFRCLQVKGGPSPGYAPHARNGKSEHYRNGKGKKTVPTEPAQFDLDVPRDRDSRFEPQLVNKRQRRLDGCDAKGLAVYARGLSTRAMQAHLEEL
jgi:putative transposase